MNPYCLLIENLLPPHEDDSQCSRRIHWSPMFTANRLREGGANILNDGIRPLPACLDQNIQQLSTSFSLQRAHGDSRVLSVEEMLRGIGYSATTSLLGSWCSARSESSDSGEEH